MPDTTPSRIHPLPAAAAYLGLAMIQTLPLALNPATRLPAGAVDLWPNHWNFWWWRHCLWGLRHNPLHSDYLYFPTGTEAVFHLHSPFNMLISAPVNLIWGETAAYNFCILLAVASAGFFTFLLARDLTSNDRAAFLAGLVYAFIPQRMEFIMENLNLFSSQFVPLALLFFRRVALRGGLRNAAGLGLAFACAALCDWHISLELAMVLLGIAAWYLGSKPRPKGLLARDWMLAGALACLVLSPLLVPMARIILSGATYIQKPQTDRGIDLALLFIPHFSHPLWGRFTADFFWNKAQFAAPGFGCYLGFVPMLLVGVALRHEPRAAWKWGVLFAGTMLLALGAHPRLMGESHTGITLPFAAFERLPILSMLRVANRFFVMAALAWAVMAAFGAARLLGESWWAWRCAWVLILVEFAWLPLPTQSAIPPEGYRRIGIHPSPGAVLDLPMPPGIRQGVYMHGQTAHGRPMAGGYLSTTDDKAARFLATEPALADLFDMNPPLTRPVNVQRLRELGFGFVVLHRDRTTGLARIIEPPAGPHDLYRRKIAGFRSGLSVEKFQRLQTDLLSQCGRPIFEDDDLVVFQLPE